MSGTGRDERGSVSVEMSIAMFATLVFLLALVSVLLAMYARTVMTVAAENVARAAATTGRCPADGGAAVAGRTVGQFAGHVERADWSVACDDTDPDRIVVELDANMRPVFPIEGWDLRWREQFRVQVAKR